MIVHWKFLLETCIVGSGANYVREAFNVLDALTSDCVLPPHMKFLTKYYCNVIVSDHQNASCRPADHVLEEQNMIVKDLIRHSDGKWSIPFLDYMSLAAIACRTTQQRFSRRLHPDRYQSSKHTDGDISNELKNAAKALAADFARAPSDVVFSQEGIKSIDPKYYEADYIASRVKTHWQHVRVERGQVMSTAVAPIDGCDCYGCVVGAKQ